MKKYLLQFFLAQAKDGRIFTVYFTKKDGTKRMMNARLGVTKGLKGTGLKYDPIKKNVLPVFDMQKGEYRSINFSTVERIAINKETIIFNW